MYKTDVLFDPDILSRNHHIVPTYFCETQGSRSDIYKHILQIKSKNEVNLVQVTLIIFSRFFFRAVASSIIGGGGLIFIYTCSNTIKTIDFKGN